MPIDNLVIIVAEIEVMKVAKKRTNPTPAAAKEEKPWTLKDLLRPDVLEQLKAKANELTSAEEAQGRGCQASGGSPESRAEKA